jgi:hypothetical protein
MREAADMIIDKDCLEIAQALSESSKKGQILSAKFLYELAEKKEKAGEGESAHKFRSMASELASAPLWTGDWPKDENVEGDEDDS